MGGEGEPGVVACGGDLSYDSPHPVGCLVPRWCLTVFGGSLCRICCLCFDSYVLDCVTAIQWNHGPCVAGPICMRYVLCRVMQILWMVPLFLPPWFLHFVPGTLANVRLFGVWFYSTLDSRLMLTL